MSQFQYRQIRLGKFRLSGATVLWFGLALIATLAQVGRHSYKNYLIFKGVFWHLWAGTNLFAEYPAEYTDTNHYGPAFAPIIAPFAVLPDWLGVTLWCLVNAAVLWWAVKRLPLPDRSKLLILSIGAVEMMTATHNVQFNTMLTGLLVLAWVGVEEENDFWATLAIAIGFFVKLYGIGGILFFFFSRHKLKFIASFLFWCAVLFALPMLFSSPQFVLQSYIDWYHSLQAKNAQNVVFEANSGMQDISVMGMIRRMSGHVIDNWPVLLPAGVLIAAPLLRLKQYRHRGYRLSYLAIVLISVVIFSSSAESSTYVIPVIGVGIWYVLNRRRHYRWALFLLVLVLLLTELSPTDLFPAYIKVHYIRAYSLKCLPVFAVWCWLIAQVARTDFSRMHNLEAA
ncbi:glycosyltransferase family 87 protein [Flaviaesturariibacter terrae]